MLRSGAFVGPFLLLAGDAAVAQTTTRASIASSGVAGDSLSHAPRISDDGRYVAFESYAANLVPDDGNGRVDVFVHDRWYGTTELVSVASSGAQGDGDSVAPRLSSDGRFVCFQSAATNLGAGDTNGRVDVFVRDRSSGTTERVSVGAGGAQADHESWLSCITPDGRYVAFASRAANLVAGDTNDRADVFVRDRSNGTTERVSLGNAGQQASDASSEPSISADGRFVAFTSLAPLLVEGDTGADLDVFVRNRQNQTTQLVSVTSAGTQGDAHSSQPSISADGRYVAFTSTSLLVPGDLNGRSDVYLRDRAAGATTLVSVSSAEGPGNWDSSEPSISAGGQFVVFTSLADNFVPGDTNAQVDVFLRDVLVTATWRMSQSTAGDEPQYACLTPSVSADGRHAAWWSDSGNLVPGDTNASGDVFLRDRSASAPRSFCAGDGSAAACPCANSGGPGHGCANSVDASGALLAAYGAASISSDTLVLCARGMPDSFALYYQGTAQVNGGQGALFGDGLRCVGGSIIRLATQTNSGGSSRYPEPGDAPISVRGANATGQTRTYQIWYRNAAAYCTAGTSNQTNGLQIIWGA